METEDRKPVTVLDLAVYRGAKAAEDGSFSAAEIEKTGLPFMGGCGRCNVTVAAYNSSPTKSGYICCTDGCAGDGWYTLEEANQALFGELEAVTSESTDDEARIGAENRLMNARCLVREIQRFLDGRPVENPKGATIAHALDHADMYLHRALRILRGETIE